jgi:predicted nucleotidyltransferase
VQAPVDVASELRRFLGERREDLVAVYLFGSTARGTATSRSDVDVAVLFAGPSPATVAGLRLDLEADLERRLGRPVQLVVLNHAPCDLVHRVLRDGILVLDRDPSARIRFEVRARNEYFDLKPFLDRYRRPGAPRPA